jgi:Ribosomal RNA adenine dimethylase
MKLPRAGLGYDRRVGHCWRGWIGRNQHIEGGGAAGCQLIVGQCKLTETGHAPFFIVQRIPAGAFYPAPDVDSAVVRIDLSDQLCVNVRDVDWFFKVAKAGFGQKRKQLHNSIAAGLPIKHEQIVQALNEVGIDPKRRAETLTLEEWGRLSDQLIS